MAETLGLLVSTDRHFSHLLNIVRTARKKGKNVLIFFTGRGVLLTQSPRFKDLAPLAEMSLCRVSFESLGLDENIKIPGLPESSFVSQARHRDIIDRCDRYLVL